MTYPKQGESIAVVVASSWPTISGLVRAAEALDMISGPKVGDVLRAVADGMERGPIAESVPWSLAKEGEFWAFETEHWIGERLFKRTHAGWVHSGKRHHPLTERIVSGRIVFAPTAQPRWSVVGSTPEGQKDA